MARHTWADVIHDWAEGEIIQFKRDGKWVDYTSEMAPVFRVDYEYRVKPKNAERPFIRLTDEEIREILGPFAGDPISGYTRKLFDEIQDKLEEKNK